MCFTIKLTAVAFFFLLLCVFPASVHGQGAERGGRDNRKFAPVAPGDAVFNIRRRRNCLNLEFREIEGTCTNNFRPVAGSASTAQFSYFTRHSSVLPSGADLPSARFISNVMSSQPSDVFNDRGISEFLVFFGQFLDHTMVTSTANKKIPFNIPIPRNDPFFGNKTGILHFTRNVRAEPEEFKKNTRNFGIERPINLLSSAIDLASVYSSSPDRIKVLRAFKDGKMATSGSNMLPLNTKKLQNAPSTSPSFFIAGDHRANEHPVLTSLHTLFLREHNLLADELKKTFPEFKDELLFQYARKVNIAQFQKIVFEEFFPTITGRQLLRYKRFRGSAAPAISVEFSTAAYRLGHTMIGNEITRRGKGMSFIPSIPMKKMFFPGNSVINNGIEPFLRGATYQRAQEVDVLVVDALRNFLFTNVPGEEGFDLIAMNIQRGRDHALRSYNDIRQAMLLNRARRFSDISSNPTVQMKLQTAYGTVDKVEAWVGLVSEDHMPRSSMGRTMFRIWEEEFLRLRDGDRFFYKANKLFPKSFTSKFKRLNEIYKERNTMAKIILRNTDMTEREIGNSIWMGKNF